MAPRHRQRALFDPTAPTWGGRRRCAGRKRVGDRPCVPHRPRARHDVRHPVHVTLRRSRVAPSLRSSAIFSALRAALAAANRAEFRVIHFSVQTDHVHLMVEADLAGALRRGVQGLAIRCARAVNRAACRRGAVWADRYHSHALGSPREVLRGMVYVLLNFRKHLRAAPGVDPYSSGPWFAEWARPMRRSSADRPVARPRTWLAAVGWRRAGGPISWHEAPAGQPDKLTDGSRQSARRRRPNDRRP